MAASTGPRLGKPTKGKKTRSNKSTNKFIVRSRHDRKKSQ
jgi:large subunit ribosomal protein L2